MNAKQLDHLRAEYLAAQAEGPAQYLARKCGIANADEATRLSSAAADGLKIGDEFFSTILGSPSVDLKERMDDIIAFAAARFASGPLSEEAAEAAKAVAEETIRSANPTKHFSSVSAMLSGMRSAGAVPDREALSAVYYAELINHSQTQNPEAAARAAGCCVALHTRAAQHAQAKGAGVDQLFAANEDELLAAIFIAFVLLYIVIVCGAVSLVSLTDLQFFLMKMAIFCVLAVAFELGHEALTAGPVHQAADNVLITSSVKETLSSMVDAQYLRTAAQ